jgi:hypothetical protein
MRRMKRLRGPTLLHKKPHRHSTSHFHIRPLTRLATSTPLPQTSPTEHRTDTQCVKQLHGSTLLHKKPHRHSTSDPRIRPLTRLDTSTPLPQTSPIQPNSRDPCSTGVTTVTDMDNTPSNRGHINTIQPFSVSPQHLHLLFIDISLSATPFMNTRRKNKSAHPGKPVMTPSQLSSAGLPVPRRPKKLTKDQQIAALKDELRAAQEQVRNVFCFIVLLRRTHKSHCLQNHSNVYAAHDNKTEASFDAGGDTDPATDTDEIQIIGTKRKSVGSARSTSRYPTFIHIAPLY